jgi:uncharacterized membrane protein YphA (DoxX/SURF4 family)
MIFPKLVLFTPVALLLLRFMVGVVFIDSGWRDVRAPKERSASIEKSQAFTIVLGCAEIAGGAGVVLGIWPQLAASGLAVVMLGAIYEKAFVWHTGFWGGKTIGWHYDLTLLVVNLVIIATNGGPYVLTT